VGNHHGDKDVSTPHRLISQPDEAAAGQLRCWLAFAALAGCLAATMSLLLPEASLAQKPDPFLSAAPPAAATAPGFKPSAARAPKPSSYGEPARAPQAPDTPPIDAELSAWQAIVQSRNATDFESFLSRFPQGRFAESARAQLVVLRPSPQPVAPAPGSAGTPSRHRESRGLLRVMVSVTSHRSGTIFLVKTKPISASVANFLSWR
jgi:hypothetical protein